MGNVRCSATTRHGTKCLNANKRKGLCLIHYKEKFGCLEPVVINAGYYEKMNWRDLSKFVLGRQIFIERIEKNLPIEKTKLKMIRKILDKKIGRGSSKP